MELLHSIILGIIEGLTEFLPISSTAHLIIAGEWLRVPDAEFLKTFNISIQLGAILAVVILYWKKILSSWSLIFKIGTAFAVTSAIGLALYKITKEYLMENLPLIAATLLLGGIAIIVLERYYSRKQSDPSAGESDLNSISYKQAAKIGIFQALAIVPGVSRSAATILGGLNLNISRKNIVEFSFLLAIPTMAAATGLDLYESRQLLGALGSHELTVWLVGFITAFITAVIGVKFLLRFIQKNNFSPFGWYRIVFSLVLIGWLIIK